MQTVTVPLKPSVLGKRKARKEDDLVFRLTPKDSSSSYSEYEYSEDNGNSEPEAGPSNRNRAVSRTHTIVNGVLVQDSKLRYQCTHTGCKKAYPKPARLAEHERSHTGDRPFVCGTCNKSYLRETHLHAHSRSHLPHSARPFSCDRLNCGKRFWTSQHLQAHSAIHEGAKPYECVEAGCSEAFAKHHQLRAHICAAHSAPGTKPYICDHPQCSKSFDTNQHLKSHQKTHDEKRYACTHASCLTTPSALPTYFQTWSALQTHMKMAHPPTCSHPACNGRTFSNHGNLRAHMKLHEDRETEAILDTTLGPDSDQEGPRKKRRGGEYGRDWKCDYAECDKDFKSKRALTNHINVKHLGKRDFLCQHPACGRSFGYKHLLQRHHSKTHGTKSSASEDGDDDEDDNETEIGHAGETNAFSIESVTGLSYEKRSQNLLKTSPKAFSCPHPDLRGLLPAVEGTEIESQENSGSPCAYVFTRAYDLRRHLLAIHDIRLEKANVDAWVRRHRQSKA